MWPERNGRRPVKCSETMRTTRRKTNEDDKRENGEEQAQRDPARSAARASGHHESWSPRGRDHWRGQLRSRACVRDGRGSHAAQGEDRERAVCQALRTRRLPGGDGAALFAPASTQGFLGTTEKSRLDRGANICHAFATTTWNAAVDGGSHYLITEHSNRPTSHTKIAQARATPDVFVSACRPVRIPLGSPHSLASTRIPYSFWSAGSKPLRPSSGEPR